MSYPGLRGLVDQLPIPGQPWPAERRARWLEAFTLVLDYAIPVEPEVVSAPTESGSGCAAIEAGNPNE
jgi:hypothetical protein